MKKLTLVALILLSIIGFKLMTLNNKNTFTFGTFQLPFSSDPMDYDAYAHHYGFTSVLAGLVSTYKNGEVVSLLAESWLADENFSKWTFKIRKNLTYSNGQKITVEDIALNFKRIAFLKKISGSESGLLENLISFEQVKGINEKFDGIFIEDNNLVFKFNKSMPDLLERLSFGFYSLAHPDLFDHTTGKWKDKKKIIASGPYEVELWDEKNFILKLRKDIPYVDYSNGIERIVFKVFVNERTAKAINEYDLIVAEKASLMITDNFEFLGPENNLKIGYVQCYSWDRKNSPLNNLEVRKWFRQKFYDGLGAAGFQTINNFFPTLKDDHQANHQIFEQPNFKKFELKTHTMSESVKIDINERKKSISEYFQNGLENLGKNSGAYLNQLEDENLNEELDLGIEGTGVEGDNHIETARFMFFSKQGIKLPDSTGEISKELRKNSPDINLINKLIWDQAIIWPIRHYSSGFWFNKNSNINYADMNYNTPALDFQFLKWK